MCKICRQCHAVNSCKSFTFTGAGGGGGGEHKLAISVWPLLRNVCCLRAQARFGVDQKPVNFDVSDFRSLKQWKVITPLHPIGGRLCISGLAFCSSKNFTDSGHDFEALIKGVNPSMSLCSLILPPLEMDLTRAATSPAAAAAIS